ncbi:unnamed protein product [Brugia timori]|uniref:Uncharacterized protein n=1 Tax=Brugia timori TaxID=42155 RepID=A0A0R3Q4Z0_9BILA|nr:unnamed protein product [Brugia timori]
MLNSIRDSLKCRKSVNLIQLTIGDFWVRRKGRRLTCSH